MRQQQASSSAPVLISALPPSPELHDRMYADLVASLVWSRNNAEKRAEEAEARLHELHQRIANQRLVEASGSAAAGGTDD